MDLALAASLGGEGQSVLGQVRAAELVQEVSDAACQRVVGQAAQPEHHLTILQDHHMCPHVQTSGLSPGSLLAPPLEYWPVPLSSTRTWVAHF